MSASEWTFFTYKWYRYTQRTKLSSEQKFDELWACINTDIKRLAINDDSTTGTTDDRIVSLKKLAMMKLHPSLQVMYLHEMK